MNNDNNQQELQHAPVVTFSNIPLDDTPAPAGFDALPAEAADPMVTVADIQFKPGGKVYFFDPGKLILTEGDEVIIDTARGPEYGYCAGGNHEIPTSQVVPPLRPVIRVATEKDKQTRLEYKRREFEALATCQQKAAEHNLEMKMVSAEYSFDGSRILFYFTADGRVDFRDLVKDLAAIFRTRIELRQIGVRDEAKMLGGLGICGRPFCCNQFLDDFQPVSIKMAKTQSLSLNPTKISGTCGRLMCCLKYEQDAYEDAVKRCPKQESFVECPDGVGNVSAVNLLKEQVKVRLEDSTEQPQTYRIDEIRVIRNGKGKRPEDYVAPPKAELEKLRYIPPVEERRDRRFGEASDLAARLEQYMGASKSVEEQAGEEKSRSGSRRRRHRGGKKEGQSAHSEQPKAAAKEQPKGGKQQPKQAKPAKEQPAPAKPQGGENQPKSGSGQHRRRHRPHHRKKPSGEGAKQ